MFSALHPLLLWGAAAVAVPILIHLMLRQRPRPRPWAAMQWLLAAIKAAQRRYRLTNLLLLLLRCLLILLVALAVARPNLAGLGSGGRLVLIIDTTASMGSRGDDPGPLSAAKAGLEHASLPRRTSVITIADEVVVRADGGAGEAASAIARLTASEIPGGVDRAAEAGQGERVLGVLTNDADVVLISDFQQDDGEILTGLLKPHCRSVTRWLVGSPTPNATIVDIGELPDLVPRQPGELSLRIAGPIAEAQLSVDGGPPVPARLVGEGDLKRLAVPPLDAGEHRLGVNLIDHALEYDNHLELPVRVRPAVPTLAVEERKDYLGAALRADHEQLTNDTIRPSQLGTAPLPQDGLVALRARTGDGERLANWVWRDAGVLWADLEQLRDDPALAPLVNGIEVKEGSRDGGPLNSGERDIDDQLGRGVIAKVRACTLPDNADVLLRAGAAPLVVALPAGRGWVIVELQPLKDENALEARTTTPTWVRRVVRRFTGRLGQPQRLQAGTAAPEAMTLVRSGLKVEIAAGQPLLLPPGAWSRSGEDGADHPLLILPNQAEGRLTRHASPGTVGSVDRALPRARGADWGLPLLIAALAMGLIEGALGAWAGKRYGR